MDDIGIDVHKKADPYPHEGLDKGKAPMIVCGTRFRHRHIT